MAMTTFVPGAATKSIAPPLEVENSKHVKQGKF
jgi:hypothetical protein